MRSLSSNVLSTSTRKTIGLGVITQPLPFRLLDLEACASGLSFLSGPVTSENQPSITTLRYSASSSYLPHDRGRSFEPLPRDSEDLVEERSPTQPEKTTPDAPNP